MKQMKLQASGQMINQEGEVWRKERRTRWIGVCRDRRT